jgi:hypothetical protein
VVIISEDGAHEHVFPFEVLCSEIAHALLGHRRRGTRTSPGRRRRVAARIAKRGSAPVPRESEPSERSDRPARRRVVAGTVRRAAGRTREKEAGANAGEGGRQPRPASLTLFILVATFSADRVGRRPLLLSSAARDAWSFRSLASLSWGITVTPRSRGPSPCAVHRVRPS